MDFHENRQKAIDLWIPVDLLRSSWPPRQRRQRGCSPRAASSAVPGRRAVRLSPIHPQPPGQLRTTRVQYTAATTSGLGKYGVCTLRLYVYVPVIKLICQHRSWGFVGPWRSNSPRTAAAAPLAAATAAAWAAEPAVAGVCAPHCVAAGWAAAAGCCHCLARLFCLKPRNS